MFLLNLTRSLADGKLLYENVVFTSRHGQFVEIVKDVHVSLKVSDWFNYEKPCGHCVHSTFPF